MCRLPRFVVEPGRVTILSSVNVRQHHSSKVSYRRQLAYSPILRIVALCMQFNMAHMGGDELHEVKLVD